jgi:glucan biosynthesis protein C
LEHLVKGENHSTRCYGGFGDVSSSMKQTIPREERDIAIDALRSFAVILVVFIHAALAYTSFSTYNPLDYTSSVAAVVDPHRWPVLDWPFGLVYLFFMPLLFLISGLFVFPGLDRRGSGEFFLARLRRLGVPFIAAAFLLSPLAFWPSYLMGRRGSPTPYWIRYFTVDGWLIGAAWFLWVLLAFDGIVALVHRVAPAVLGKLRREPTALVIVLVTIVAFVPVSFFVPPDSWVTRIGPFDVQPGKLPLFFANFCLGMALGSGQKWRSAGWPKHWGYWLLVGIAAFFVYSFVGGTAAGLAIRLVNRTAFAVSCAGLCLGLLGAFRHFVRKRRVFLDSLNENAFGIYLFHYAIVHWLQYVLVPLSWPAPLKFCIVFSGGLAVSWGVSHVLRRVPAIRRFM